MRVARPSTLWRMVTGDLWKLLALTAAVIVAVTVFGFTVRPLADGRLGPVEALRFMALAIVPMMQYALPFAAGFSATLVYHRLAVDQESTAAYAAGISHRSLLAPAVITAFGLAAGLLLLADQAMPRLLRTATEMVTDDVAKLIVGQVRRGDSIQIDRRLLYADGATTLGPDPKSGAYEQLVLSGVLAVELGENGEVVREASGRVAYVWLYRGRSPAVDGRRGGVDDPGGTTVVLRLRDAVGQGLGMGVSELEDSTAVYRIPNTFLDDPKYFSWAQLERVRQRPETMDWIDAIRRSLAAAMSEEAVAGSIAGELSRDGRLALEDGAGRAVLVRARGLGPRDAAGGWPLVAPAAGIEVVTTDAAGAQRVQRAARGTLVPQSKFDGETGLIDLRLEEVSGQVARDADAREPAAPAGRLSRWSVEGLRFAGAAPGNLLSLSCEELLARADNPGDTRVRDEAARLRTEIRYLQQEITSKLHERLATAVAAGLMVLCGAVLGLRHAASLPLTVYLWSFLPALVCLLTISGGQKSAHSYGWPGLLLLWGGVVGMAGFAFVEYRQLARR